MKDMMFARVSGMMVDLHAFDEDAAAGPARLERARQVRTLMSSLWLIAFAQSTFEKWK